MKQKSDRQVQFIPFKSNTARRLYVTRYSASMNNHPSQEFTKGKGGKNYSTFRSNKSWNNSNSFRECGKRRRVSFRIGEILEQQEEEEEEEKRRGRKFFETRGKIILQLFFSACPARTSELNRAWDRRKSREGGRGERMPGEKRKESAHSRSNVLVSYLRSYPLSRNDSRLDKRKEGKN